MNRPSIFSVFSTDNLTVWIVFYSIAGGHGLQILNARQEDAGQYTCIVTNEIGEAIRNYEVKVFSKLL